jgi:hypothetical protein
VLQKAANLGSVKQIAIQHNESAVILAGSSQKLPSPFSSENDGRFELLFGVAQWGVSWGV